MIRLFATIFIAVWAAEAQNACPMLGISPPLTNSSCFMTVVQSSQNCRKYSQQCSGVNPCSSANEINWICSSLVEPSCVQPSPTCDQSCGPPKCQCTGGYVRNSAGQCIRLEDCPQSGSSPPEPVVVAPPAQSQPIPPTCPANEVYQTCSSQCEPTCASRPDQVCPAGCGPPKCQCAAGYVRNAAGVCILKHQCPPRPAQSVVCGLNEVFLTCSSQCEPSCSTPADELCPAGCGPPRCQCAPGFVRDFNSVCVRREQCPQPPSLPPPIKCGVNEVLATCSSLCEETCSTVPDQPCPAGCGPPKCQCAAGFVRDVNGACIPREQCPPPPTSGPAITCGVNEVLATCSSLCEPTCLTTPDQPCTPGCGPPKCQCAPGFVRGFAGTCIPREQCPPPPTGEAPIVCGANEILMTCSSLCEETCFPRNEPCPAGCGPPKCQCVAGYVRGLNGVCIRKEQCPLPGTAPPPITCGVNEVLATCSSLCEPSCMTNPHHSCPSGCGPPKCQCAPGFVRGINGVCIPRSQCPPPVTSAPPIRCGVNEVLAACSSLCEPTCTSNPNQACPSGCGPPKCQCAEGYVRNYTGFCIRREECPPPVTGAPPIICPANEVLATCSSLCEETCIPRNQPCPAGCGPPKCQCAPGYVRDVSGTCIPKQQCPPPPTGAAPIKCRLNEVLVTCSSLCEETCFTNPNQPCPSGCGPPKCQCAPGFVRGLTGACISRLSCPPRPTSAAPIVCGLNEVLATCSSLCEESCVPRTQPCPSGCGPPRCQCAPGFVRNLAGVCIRREQCPRPPTPSPPRCPLNEEYKECSSQCEPTCVSPPNQVCPAVCGPPQCQCIAGYVRNNEGVCILRSACPLPPATPAPQRCGLNEIYLTCSSLCEETCVPRPPTLPCPPGCGPPKCQCAPGFVRNGAFCILRQQCPQPATTVAPRTCPLNEEYQTCSTQCEPTCDSPPDQYCPPECGPPRCQCRPGFVRNKQGVCVLRTSCPVPPASQAPMACGVNEVFKTCSSLCEGTCMLLAQPERPCPDGCGPPRCQCADGYVRNAARICIMRQQCPLPPTPPPPSCPLNEEHQTCSSTCEPTCSTPQDQVCPAKCGPPRCQCRPGLVRNAAGACVPRASCPAPALVSPPPRCNLNEVFATCSSLCEETCTPRPATLPCPSGCGPPKCQCAQGYVRHLGNCIMRQQCPAAPSAPPPPCPLNEEYRQCSSMCEPTCTSPVDQVCSTSCGPPKCQCRDGFVRNALGACILRGSCPAPPPTPVPIRCGLNEVLAKCSSLCEPTCLSRPDQVCPSGCGPQRCQCAEGYVRHNGVCIMRQQCPQTSTTVSPVICPINEEYKRCSSPCEPTCLTLPNQVCAPACGPPKCQCKDGFVRNQQGVCVSRAMCGPPPVLPQRCAENEIFVACSSLCEPTCDSDPDRRCPVGCGGPKCQCAPGYVRHLGACILPGQCPMPSTPVPPNRCPPNEEWKRCSSVCEPSCYRPQNQVCPAVCGPPRCQCKDGLVRDGDGRCISPTLCPQPPPTVPPVKCGINEVYMQCSSQCEETCIPRSDLLPCPSACGPPKCQCAPGYVRNAGGVCILRGQCPLPSTPAPSSQCGINEEFKVCSSQCEPTCSSLQRICPAVCGPPKCQCRPGFVRYFDNTCVPRSTCPQPVQRQVCGPNEVFAECSDLCERTCSPQTDRLCNSNAGCGPPKCQCAPGYVRGPGGGCIMAAQCPITTTAAPQCPINEEFKSCSSTCEPTCTSPPDQVCPAVCGPPMCQCRAGYVRSANGECILRALCPRPGVFAPSGIKCGLNEVFANCSSLCEATCDPYPNRLCRSGCGPPKCQCAPGFVRNAFGACVLKQQCPPTATPIPKCPANEEYKQCSTNCEPTCSSPPDHVCPPECGPPRCQCIPGFVRNSAGACVLRGSCPIAPAPAAPVRCGLNEVFQTCSSLCEETCDRRRNTICPSGCGPPKCQCAEGYVRNAAGICIMRQQCPPLPSQAPPSCPLNEEYKLCSSQCEPTCATRSGQVCAPECGPPRCQCIAGFVRNSAGTCVLPASCPSSPATPAPQRCGLNEIFVTCSSLCEETCTPRPHFLPCPSGCGAPKCQCAQGYVRHLGNCIMKQQCPQPFAPPPPKACPINEDYKSCSSMCEPTCTSPPDQVCVAQCGPPKCQCREGFVRNEAGTCVLRLSCPAPPATPGPVICGVNEVFAQCSSLCEETCSSLPNQPCPSGCGPPKCQCGPGYVRNAAGICIMRQQCPTASNAAATSRCPANEEYKVCSSLCEPTCTSQANQVCPAGCGPPKCQCKQGYVRSAGGDCILRLLCPVPTAAPTQNAATTCGRNEVFTTCSSLCEPKCNSRPDQPCPLGCGPPKCQCALGYVRSETGECVTRDQCPASSASYSPAQQGPCLRSTDCPNGLQCMKGRCSDLLRHRSDVNFNTLSPCTSHNECSREGELCYNNYCTHLVWSFPR